MGNLTKCTWIEPADRHWCWLLSAVGSVKILSAAVGSAPVGRSIFAIKTDFIQTLCHLSYYRTYRLINNTPQKTLNKHEVARKYRCCRHAGPLRRRHRARGGRRWCQVRLLHRRQRRHHHPHLQRHLHPERRHPCSVHLRPRCPDHSPLHRRLQRSRHRLWGACFRIRIRIRSPCFWIWGARLPRLCQEVQHHES